MQSQTRAGQTAFRRRAWGEVLAAAVDIGIAARDLAGAGQAVQELSTLADGVDAPCLRALAARAQAALLLAEGHSQGALAALRRAWMECQAIDLPYEARAHPCADGSCAPSTGRRGSGAARIRCGASCVSTSGGAP